MFGILNMLILTYRANIADIHGHSRAWVYSEQVTFNVERWGPGIMMSLSFDIGRYQNEKDPKTTKKKKK